MKLNYEKCFYSLECNENTILVRVFNTHGVQRILCTKIEKKEKMQKDKRAKRMTRKRKRKQKQEKVCHRLFFNVFMHHEKYLTMVLCLYADRNKAQGCVKIIMISRMSYYLWNNYVLYCKQMQMLSSICHEELRWEVRKFLDKN